MASHVPLSAPSASPEGRAPAAVSARALLSLAPTFSAGTGAASAALLLTPLRSDTAGSSRRVLSALALVPVSRTAILPRGLRLPVAASFSSHGCWSRAIRDRANLPLAVGGPHFFARRYDLRADHPPQREQNANGRAASAKSMA